MNCIAGFLIVTRPSTQTGKRTKSVYYSSAKVRKNTGRTSFVNCSSYSSLPSSETTSENVYNFVYNRASPSVRWPDLVLKELHSPQPRVPSTSIHFVENVDDDTDSKSESPENELEILPESFHSDETLEIMGRPNKTRAKKMTKLALKRAKDWRRRVQLLTDKILNLGPTDFVADVLDDRKVQMTPTDFCFVVKSVGNLNWQRALEVYEWLNLRHWYSPNARMLATILAVLGKANQEALAEEIFTRTELEIGNVVQVYNAMMGVYARNGRFSKVQELLGVMRSRGCEPDLVSFNTLINARAKSGSLTPGLSLELLHNVQKAGLRPDIITYNTIISACSHGSNLEDAVKVFDEMLAHRCSPDLWTYNAMISVYGHCGMAADAEHLFKELREKGFFPDAVTYNSLLFAFARVGNMEKVEKVCQEMADAGFEKDEMTYNTIIHMYGKQGRNDLAFQFYKDMKLSGRKPDAVTYTVLIDSLGKTDQVSDAENIMLEMVDAGVKPTLQTYSALICAYAKAGRSVDALQTFDRMLRSGIKPDFRAYSVILDVLLRSKETKRAVTMYREMLRDGFRPDQELYRLMVQTFTKDNQHNFVEQIVKDMQELCNMNPQTITTLLVRGECFIHAAQMMKLAITQGYKVDNDCLLSILNWYTSSGMHSEARVLLDFTLEKSPSSLEMVAEAFIIMLCKDHKLDSAIEEFTKRKISNKAGSCDLYEALISCCEDSESYAEAIQIFSDMKFYVVKPSRRIYQSMINIYTKAGFPETANYLMEDAEKGGILFSDTTIYATLIEAYGNLKLWQKAEGLVGRFRLHSVVDRKIWNALIQAYAVSGRYEQARVVFDRMVKDGPFPTVDSINGLIQALIADERLSEIYVVIQDLQDMGFKISKSTILLMLDAFARAGNIFEVKKIYNGMKAAGYLPTMHLYRSIIGLLCQGKRVRDVELMISEMEDAGFKPDLIIFNNLLKLYTTIGDFRKTSEVYQAIQADGLNPNEDTYNSLVLMYSKDLRPEEGLSLLHEMEKQGLEPKLATYKNLISAFGKLQLWEQAEALFEDMKTKNYSLDRSLYHTMMKIYRDTGNHLKAENILILMKKNGMAPTVATMHLLMLSYSSAGQPKEAENILNTLTASDLDLNSIVQTSVIDAYLKNGQYNLGVEKLIEMKEKGIEPDHRVWTCFIRAGSLCQSASQALFLLNTLRDTGFALPIRLLTDKSESLVLELDSFLEQLRSIGGNAALNFVNAIEDLLWAFERRATASWVFQLAIRRGIYRHDLIRVEDKDWGADVRKLSPGAALVALTLWLDNMQDASLEGVPESPKSVVLITGTAEYNKISLNKTLKAYLWEMGSPFLPCKTRSGLLIAKAHSLRMWLKDSAFCSDLELKDASSLPESNSMQLTDGYLMRAGLVPAFKDIQERLGFIRPKKFARLALLSGEKRDKVITADIEGREQKLEKLNKRGGVVTHKKPFRNGTRKFIRKETFLAKK